LPIPIPNPLQPVPTLPHSKLESRRQPEYNRIMSPLVIQIGVFAMRVLEVMFFVGMAGSSIVVLISFVEDAKELFGED
jgi:hypothetical protein